MAGATIARKTTGTAACDAAFQQCIHPACATTFSIDEAHFSCPACGDVVDVVYDWDRLPVPGRLADFEAKWADRLEPLNFSGVWRFRDLLPFAVPDMVVTIGEGQTLLQKADKVGQYVGMSAGNLLLQYEGMNPSGSFKDNGMTAAFTHARMVGARRVACASTGNTSAALAVYCSATEFGFRAIIFIGSGKIAYGKLAQALDHGALTIQIKGDFDDAMLRVRQVSDRLGIYLMNSVNPFRLEGQKTIMYRVLEGLGWEVPDWIVVPGGNLGNSSAFGKAFIELLHLGLIARVPRLAVINASGARTLDELFGQRGVTWRSGLPEMDKVSGYYNELDTELRKASTIASAIEINRPVNLKKCLRCSIFATEWCGRSAIRRSWTPRRGWGQAASVASRRVPRASREPSDFARRESSPGPNAWSASSPATNSKIRPRPSPITGPTRRILTRFWAAAASAAPGSQIGR